MTNTHIKHESINIVTNNSLLQKLLQDKLLTLDQIKVVESEHLKTGKKIDTLLIELGFVNKQILMNMLSQDSALEHIDLDRTKIDLKLARQSTRDLCEKNLFLAFDYDLDSKSLDSGDLDSEFDSSSHSNSQTDNASDKRFNRVCIAISAKPDVVLKDKIKRIYGEKIKFFLSEEQKLLEKIGEVFSEKEIIENWMDLIEQPIDSNKESFATRILHELIAEAVKRGVSDIHFEPEEFFVRIRLRIDGVLQTLAVLPKDKWSNILVRIKILAEMDIAKQFLPQDGRFFLNIFGKEIDLRVSSHPVVFGENIVIRILDRRNAVLSLEELGYSEYNMKQIEKILKHTHGIFIVTGPTGSGKSTLLFSMLLRLNKPEVSITTIEEPVEYSFPMFRQTDIHHYNQLDFASAIKSILRQDPDIIALNEIRDGETATMAVRAAMTGRFVMTTLHTHDIFGIFDRLDDLGVNKKLLTNHLAGIGAQRLVRRVCKHCMTLREPTDEDLELLKTEYLTNIKIDKIPVANEQTRNSDKASLDSKVICKYCNGTGYKGRFAVAELLHIDKEVRQILLDNDAYKAAEIIYKKGKTMPLADELKERIMNHETTIEEATRVYALY